MSFWSTTGKVVKSVGGFALDMVKTANESYISDKEKMLKKTDSELLKIVDVGTGTRKLAAYKELKNRGHDSEDIKSKIS